MEDSKTCDYSDNVDNYRFILPFRLCLVGEMSSGKSSFVLNLLKDFKRQTNIIYTKNKSIFISVIQIKIKNICKVLNMN